jgi:hypothetical protein
MRSIQNHELSRIHCLIPGRQSKPGRGKYTSAKKLDGLQRGSGYPSPETRKYPGGFELNLIVIPSLAQEDYQPGSQYHPDQSQQKNNYP